MATKTRPSTPGHIDLKAEYCLSDDGAIGIQYTDDPYPRNVCCTMRGNPMFDLKDAASFMMEQRDCRKVGTTACIRINAFKPAHGRQTAPTPFAVSRSKKELVIDMTRLEVRCRTQACQFVA